VIYLDHNASTPLRPEALAAMQDALAESYANPSSAHRAGQSARAVVEHAREQVAALVGCPPEAIVFTSGGTEGDHAALLGAAWALERRGRRIAISSIEHHAVHGAAEVLALHGFEVEHLPVTAGGVVADTALDALPDDTTLVSVMLANNETGVVQPVAALARRAHARGMRVHCDAVQAAGKIPVSREALGVDYLVISAHKLGGPKGVGALALAPGGPFEPLFRGSAHEGGRRGGTENVIGIVGFGAAAAAAGAELDAERARISGLRERLERGVREAFPDAVVHGANAERLPNTTNVSFPGARSDALLMAMDARGVAVSAGAACASGAVEPSPVLAAMGVPRDLSVCALRLSLGRTSTEADVDATLEALGEAVPAARAVHAAGVGTR